MCVRVTDEQWIMWNKKLVCVFSVYFIFSFFFCCKFDYYALLLCAETKQTIQNETIQLMKSRMIKQKWWANRKNCVGIESVNTDIATQKRRREFERIKFFMHRNKCSKMCELRTEWFDMKKMISKREGGARSSSLFFRSCNLNLNGQIHQRRMNSSTKQMIMKQTQN